MLEKTLTNPSIYGCNRGTGTGIAASEGDASPRRSTTEAEHVRFHFHVYDGKSSLDRDGIELPDWETARIEAIRFAGEILKDDAPHVALSEDWRVEVTDEAGLILFQMLFVMTATPGLLQS